MVTTKSSNETFVENILEQNSSHKNLPKEEWWGQHATNLKGEMALFFITLREKDTADLHIDLSKMKVQKLLICILSCPR